MIKMHTCNSCNGSGYQDFYEDNRLFIETCYHCGGAGKVDSSSYRETELSEVANTLAYWHIEQMKANINSNPDGEGWDFRAAENGMSSEEYSQMTFFHYSNSFFSELLQMSNEQQDLLIAWQKTKPYFKPRQTVFMDYWEPMLAFNENNDSNLPF